MVVTLGQQYNIGEKPTVMLYTTFIALQGQQAKRRQKHCSTQFNSAIDLYIIKAYSLCILDVRFVHVPAGVTQDFSTFLLRCLP